MNDGANSANKYTTDKKSRDKQTMLPVSIKQISTASNEDGTYRLDGAEIHTVVIMGVVENIEQHSTSTTFKINDGTGSIDAKLWNNEKDGSSSSLMVRVATCQINSFLKIVGALRDFEGRKSVLIYDINPLTDWNELTHHLFQVMFVHMQNTRGPVPGSQAAKSASGSGAAPNNLFQGRGTPMGGGQHGQSSGAIHAQPDQNAGPKALLLKAFVDSQDYEGISLEHCKAFLQQNNVVNVNDHLIRTIVQELSEEGTIYSTTDEFHYALTR
jgi:replication factor A2